MSKYTNALYPDKINDLINNDGTINMPGESPIDNEAVAQELKEFIENLEGEEHPEAFDKVFRFDLATPEFLINAFEALPWLYPTYQWFRERKLYIVPDFSGITWTSENSFDSYVTVNMGFNDDAETGYYKLVIGFDEGTDLLSGTIRFNFDPNRGN